MTNKFFLSKNRMARIEAKKTNNTDTPLWVLVVWIGLVILIVNGMGW